MAEFYKLYMQKESDGSQIVETIADFGLYCAEIKFAPKYKAKEMTSRDWHDENGNDEYIPEDGIKLSACDMEIKFCYKGSKFSANSVFDKFIAYLTGANGDGASMKIYCDYTKTGKSGVRFSKISDDAELVRDNDGDILVFKVEFKVNHPTSSVTPVFGEDKEIKTLA